MIESLKQKFKKEVVPFFKKEFGRVNIMAVPQIMKVVINIGVGRRTTDEQKQIVHDLSLIVGQKVQSRPAKQSIASFKVRQGQVVGYRATLRGKRMYDFLFRLIVIALPRTRDFRGLQQSAIDESGNLTIGVAEHIVFPEMIGEETKLIFGFEVTVVTNAESKKTAAALFKKIGFPMHEFVD